MTQQRWLRFEDSQLHAQFRSLLDLGAVPYVLDEKGAVLFNEADADAIGATAHHVRNSQFDGYFKIWATEKLEACF